MTGGLLARLAAARPGAWRRADRALAPVEAAVKKPAFGCQMCGQCVLHDTGMTCPMGCPKQMRNGPCGGLGPNGECEVDPRMTCVWLKAYRRDARSPFRGHVHNLRPPVDWRLQGTSSWLNLLSGADNRAAITAPTIPGPASAPYTDGSFERLLRSRERFVLVSEVNPPDGADLTGLRALGSAMSEFADVVSVTEHGSARNHLSSVPAAVALEQEGVETIATFTCRDRNRIALQGDLLGASALGVRNVLLVTGNHPVVGDHPGARPVFDLDSITLLQTARRLRDEGRFESGRELDRAPRLFLGAACAPFAEPRDERPARVAKKVAAGADFVISQHVFEPAVFRRFVEGVAARGLLPRLHVLGAVAVLPDVGLAERLNRVLTGFTIPEEIVTRLRQARDPQETGIEIAAELLAEIGGVDGVSGALVAALGGSGGADAMHGSDLADAEIQREVLRRAGLLRPAATRRRSPHEVIRDAIAAYNAGDLDAYFALHTEDTVLVDAAGDRSSEAAAYRRQAAAARAAYTALNVSIDRLTSDGEVVTMQSTVDLGDGSPQRPEAVVFDVRGGRIARTRVYSSTSIEMATGVADA